MLSYCPPLSQPSQLLIACLLVFLLSVQKEPSPMQADEIEIETKKRTAKRLRFFQQFPFCEAPVYCGPDHNFAVQRFLNTSGGKFGRLAPDVLY